ncbi:MAG: nitronate monooxygenase [Deltaproteobacteria bacterium]|nr:nitronate monooxygenase [Deltaproteobacteria bacterium]
MITPIIQAPMAGAHDERLAIAVANAGGLGSLPCAMLTADAIRAQVAAFRAAVDAPLNLNFFSHQMPPADPAREAAWQQRLAPYFAELGAAPTGGPSRAPFDDAACAIVEELRPEIVSFHFGLPAAALVARVKATGARVWSSATTVDEAVFLERAGCDAIIAQGLEAGGHRGMFLTTDVITQVGTFALLPRVVDAVHVPVIAAGGIGDERGVAAAFALGASAVQIGTAYLRTPEATIAYKAVVGTGETCVTNVFTGRPARGIVNRMIRELGPLAADVPAFPTAAPMFAPLRAKAEAAGSFDFTPLWVGQAASLAREVSAAEVTMQLASAAPSRGSSAPLRSR